MPRNPKYRRVCVEPVSRLFKVNTKCEKQINLCIEELEAIRLIDYEGLDQIEAAARMEVSRGTFQRILYEARHKVAKALVQEENIMISGGNYIVSSKACCTSKRCMVCKFCEGDTNE